MKIVGCDLHARQQSIAMVDTETGELTEKRVMHEGNAVRDFYASLEGPVVVGIEATGAMQWFLELLEELGIECRVGHPAKIRLWVEATLHAVIKDPELKRFYRRKLIQKGMGKARVAAARKLGIRLWIMLRDEIDYEEFCRRGKLRQKGKAHAGMPDFNSGPAQAVTGSTE